MPDAAASLDAFEGDKPATAAQSDVAAAIEAVRHRGGVFVAAVRATRMAMAMTAPELPGNPIVFANQALLDLTGYSLDELIGRSPCFMDRSDASSDGSTKLRDAIAADRDELIETVQYRKDGSRFAATVLLSAFKDDAGQTVHQLLSWQDRPQRIDAEAEDALRNDQVRLRESEERLAAALDLLPIGVGIMDVDGQLTVTNPEIRRFLPNSIIPSRDTDWRLRWQAHEADGTPVDPADWPGARALRGERLSPGLEMRYIDADGNVIWAMVAAAPLRDPAGRIVGAVTAVQDITELKHANKHQRLLLAELQHRVRNILAMIRSVARQTAETAETVEDYAQHLEGRISALARTQGLLTQGSGIGADLQNIILDELHSQAAQPDEFTVTGPDVTLSGRAAEVLSLAIHELTTNSIKFGALSIDGALLDIRWALLDGDVAPRLSFIWSEIGVPLGSEPPRHGFGTELITERVPYELQGIGSLEFTSSGIVATIEFTLTDDPSILETDVRHLRTPR